MNVEPGANIYTLLNLSSHLIAILLLLTAIIILRNKKSRSVVNRSLQIFCAALWFTQLSVALVEFQLSNQFVHFGLLTLTSAAWLIAMVQIIEIANHAPFKLASRLLFFTIWLAALLGQLESFLTTPNDLQASTQSSLTTSTLIGVGLLMAGLNLYAQCNKQVIRSINSQYFLIGSMLFILLQLAQLFSLLAMPQSFGMPQSVKNLVAIIVATLCVMGAFAHPPRQAVSLSRRVIFYAAVTVPAIFFLVFLVLAGTNIQDGALEWTIGIQLSVVGIALFAIGYLALSNTARNNLRVFINKNFFRHKYDYRKVWLNLIQTLSSISNDSDFLPLGLKAVGEIFDAKGGVLWLKTLDDHFEPAATWNTNIPDNIRISTSDDFIQPFFKEEWIYALPHIGRKEHDKHNIKLPSWIQEVDHIWVIAPLLIGKKLLGFIMLTKPQSEALIWEDIDVIKSASKQLASYIVRQQSAEQLAESKQFDTYNKLTAFIMHDLKNLIAQQALVVENAKKHKENPAFVEDAIRTIDNSVDRMSHLLKRLQRNTHQPTHRSVAVKNIALEAIRKCADRQPIPTLRNVAESSYVVADQDQIVMILMHIIRNAQEATNNDGFVDIDILVDQGQVRIEVEDNGCGMDTDFLNNRLFKPFESTKSSMGMGIGAYQVREFIQAMGGKIEVSSEVDVGTTVCIQLPIAYIENQSTDSSQHNE